MKGKEKKRIGRSDSYFELHPVIQLRNVLFFSTKLFLLFSLFMFIPGL